MNYEPLIVNYYQHEFYPRPTTHDPRPTTHDPRPTIISQTRYFHVCALFSLFSSVLSLPLKITRYGFQNFILSILYSFKHISLQRVLVRNHSNGNEFDLHENGCAGETHFLMNGFARRLISTQR